VWRGFEAIFPVPKEDGPIATQAGGIKSILKVSAFTIMNGADNIGTYIPLFSQVDRAELAVYIVTFYILLGVWCLVAWLVMREKHILRLVARYAKIVVPLLYIGLGMYIVINTECFPWSIERIDDSTSLHAGKAILAPITAVLMLSAIIFMLWFRKRQVKTRESRDDAATREFGPDLDRSDSDRVCSGIGPQSEGAPVEKLETANMEKREQP
jgi:hypothetical protein